jgi:hypothetical protein
MILGANLFELLRSTRSVSGERVSFRTSPCSISFRGRLAAPGPILLHPLRHGLLLGRRHLATPTTPAACLAALAVATARRRATSSSSRLPLTRQIRERAANRRNLALKLLDARLGAQPSEALYFLSSQIGHNILHWTMGWP